MKSRWIIIAGLLAGAAMGARQPAGAWTWTNNDQEGAVLPSLQEEFEQEYAAYKARREKGLTHQERIIALDKLISTYKPQGVNTAALESERDRLTVETEREVSKREDFQKVSSELYQLAMQKTKEGRFEEALVAIQKAERLLPDDRSYQETRRKLESVTAIVPNAVQGTKRDSLVRKGVARYLENDGVRALNALRYAQSMGANQTALQRLVKLLEQEFPTVEAPVMSEGVTLVEYKLQLSLEYVYDQQYLKAINECNEVLDLEPNNVLALTRAGSAYYAMGQKARAKQIWGRALELDPNNQALKKFMRSKFGG